MRVIYQLLQDGMYQSKKLIAQAMGKDARYVRVGLQQGILKFGTAIKVGNSNEFSYYCPDKPDVVWQKFK